MMLRTHRIFPSSSVRWSPSSMASIASPALPPDSSLAAPRIRLPMQILHLCPYQYQYRYQYRPFRSKEPLFSEGNFSFSSSRRFSLESEGKRKSDSSRHPSSSPSTASSAAKTMEKSVIKPPSIIDSHFGESSLGERTSEQEAPPITMEGMWRESTARMLDLEATPVGSITSLQWHLIETLVLYWSDAALLPSSRGQPRPSPSREGRENAREKSEGEGWKDAKTGIRYSLQLLDRLVQEKAAATTEKDAGDGFRTIDISLVHVVLKQWKSCLHWANTQAKNPRKNSNSRYGEDQHPGNKPFPNEIFESRHAFTIFTDAGDSATSAPTKTNGILLPSEFLKLLDHWASITAMASVKETDDLPSSSPAPFFEPNIATYTILMDGAVSCKNPRERVGFTEALLDRLLRESSDENSSHLRPTIVTMATVLHALANSRTVASAEQAEAWLRKIPHLLPATGQQLRPNTVAYTTVVRAWADVGRADRAEGLLREMCQDYVGVGENHPGNPEAKPSLWTFNTVLAAWSRSKNPSSVMQAEGLIRTMKTLSSSSGKNTKASDAHEFNDDTEQDEIDTDGKTSVLQLDVRPTIVSYNSLMSTIASRARQPDSLAKAEHWMNEILANAVATAHRNPTNPPKHRRGSRGHKPLVGRKNDESMAPNLITYKALFNTIAGASNMSNAEKADRMRYWLARGSSQPSSPNIGGETKNGTPKNHVTEHPFLLKKIDAMEQRDII